MRSDSRVIVKRESSHQGLKSKSYEKKILEDSAPNTVFIGKAKNMKILPKV